MNASVHALNRFLAPEAKPSATYKVMMDRWPRRSAGR